MAGPTIPNQGYLSIGLTPLAYMGVRPTSPAQYLIETRDPLTTDRNYILGTWWFNNNSPYNLWRLVNLNAGVALWILVNASPGALLSLTSNSGGPVFPLAGNINVVGDGITIVGVGNPATHTITFSAVGTGTVETLTGNSGGAVSPLAGNINVVGDNTNNINIVGNPGTHTLTAAITGTTNHALQIGNASGSLTSLAVAGNGQLPIGSAGADPVIANLTAGTGITITNGAGSITIAASGSVAQSFPTDSGTATPAAGVLNIKAGNSTLNAGSSVLFTGSGNTVTLNVTDANGNTIIGKNAGIAGITSVNNTVLGKSAGAAITSGTGLNVIVGEGSGALLTTGSTNTLVGAVSGASLTTGAGNVIVGEGAGSGFTGAESNNIIMGSMSGITGASREIRIGSQTNAAGDNNVFIGNGAGVAYVQGGNSQLVGIGNLALAANTSGFYNICVGTQAGTSITSGNGNCLYGNAAGFFITGSSNTGIGHDVYFNAGASTGLISGSFNTAVGFTAGDAFTGAESSNICINSLGVSGNSNTCRIGAATGNGNLQLNKTFIHGIRGITTTNNDAIAVLIDSAGQLGTVSSSIRYKENITPMADYSNDLYRLNPVVFNYKNHSPESKSVGLIAEEVAQIMPQLVIVDSDGCPETIKYQDLVPMLLNELIKLKKRVDELEGNQ